MLSLPIALQSLITIGVNMLDTMMVGSLGDNPLSATSLANSFISVFQILCMGLGMGASVLVSRYWGMTISDPGDPPRYRCRLLSEAPGVLDLHLSEVRSDRQDCLGFPAP